MGVPVAVLAVAATFLGTERVEALRCHITQCSAQDRVARLCRLLEETEDAPASQGARMRQLVLQRTWPTSAMTDLLSRFEAAPAGGTYDVILDTLEAEGQGAFFCPAFTRKFAAPVSVTPKRIIVQGSTLVHLEQGALPTTFLGLNGLEIEGMESALGYTTDGSALRVSAPQSLSVELLYQLAYSLGRAGVPQIKFVFRGEAQRTMQVDLPPYGTCSDCLVDLPQVVASKSKLLAAIGRHGGTESPQAPHPALLVLPKQGPHFIVESSKPSDHNVLAVLAAPGRSINELARAVRAVRGSTAAPRYNKVVLAALADRSIPQEPSTLSQRVQFATHAALLPPAPPTPPKRIRSTRRSAPRPRGPQNQWVPTSLPASSEAIAQSIRPKLRSVKDCYERALKHQDRLSGKVTLHFDIDAHGRTQKVHLEDHSLGSKAVTRCIARRARHWRLPVPQDAPVSVAYPLVFAPAGA